MNKKKLSEISINAATLNGNPASYYDFRQFGLGGYPEVTTDCNQLTTNGYYHGSANGSNFPPIAGWYAIIVLFRLPTNGMQIATTYDKINPRTFIRIYSGGSWGAWVEV